MQGRKPDLLKACSEHVNSLTGTAVMYMVRRRPNHVEEHCLTARKFTTSALPLSFSLISGCKGSEKKEPAGVLISPKARAVLE